MRFEWDPAKAASNLRKHGVTFEDAMVAFGDEAAWTRPDEKHSSAQEHRQQLIGSDGRRIITVILTKEQDKDAVRIISARPASRKERKGL